jgi:hypothetical protein
MRNSRRIVSGEKEGLQKKMFMSNFKKYSTFAWMEKKNLFLHLETTPWQLTQYEDIAPHIFTSALGKGKWPA